MNDNILQERTYNDKQNIKIGCQKGDQSRRLGDKTIKSPPGMKTKGHRTAEKCQLAHCCVRDLSVSLGRMETLP